ncbi:hypothetical protein P8605_02205 [Streptomyces sp. T-3]|nr:hypothetical protein [Streptomyces sp. T-3]
MSSSSRRLTTILATCVAPAPAAAERPKVKGAAAAAAAIWMARAISWAMTAYLQTWTTTETAYSTPPMSLAACAASAK